MYYVDNDGDVFAISDGSWKFYIQDAVVYTSDGRPKFWIDDACLYEYGSGHPKFYMSE